MQSFKRTVSVLGGLVGIVALSGCAAVALLPAIAGVTAQTTQANAEATAKPAISSFSVPIPTDKAYVALVQSMSQIGELKGTDKTAGAIQGRKGSWLVNATVIGAPAGSVVSVSARFESSGKLDFNSREGIVKELISTAEQLSGAKFSPQ